MPEIIDMPGTLRVSDRGDPHLSWAGRSAGQALNGVEQVGTPLTARWTWKVVIPVRDAGTARSWRLVKSRLRGRYNYLRMRVCDRYRITRRAVGAVGSGPVSHSDGSFFSDGSGYAAAEPESTVTVAAAAGATTVTIDAGVVAEAMSAGVFVSIADWLYQVEAFEETAGDLALTLAPPLRVAAAAGDAVRFDARALWVLADDDGGAMELALGRFGTLALDLLEPIGRDL